MNRKCRIKLFFLKVYCVFESANIIISYMTTIDVNFTVPFFIYPFSSLRYLARLGWTDDIDFDLNGDLTNNSYLNKYVAPSTQ